MDSALVNPRASAKDIEAFHQHLDVCLQCQKNPFGLCVTGSKMLKRAGASQN